MKLEGCVYVSGIERIVIFGKHLWVRRNKDEWAYVLDKQKGIYGHVRADKKMCDIVKKLLARKKIELWVSGDTINIKMKDS